MIEVLFGESEAAAMKMAKEKGGILGSCEEVICLSLMLDIGNVREKVDSQNRQKLIFDMYTQNGYDDSTETLDEIREAGRLYLKEQKRLIEYVSKGEQIRIWYNNTAYTMCGFYYICDLLKSMVNEIFIVKLPEYIQINQNVIAEYQNWGEISPNKYGDFIRYEKKITQTEIKMFSNHWLELVEDNSPLRAIVNGQLIGVPVDFYDHLIYKCLGVESMKVVRLIGKILGCYSLGIGDWWYASRIEHMLKTNKLKIVEDSYRRYERIISIV